MKSPYIIQHSHMLVLCKVYAQKNLAILANGKVNLKNLIP
jgi:hypothetical protein